MYEFVLISVYIYIFIYLSIYEYVCMFARIYVGVYEYIYIGVLHNLRDEILFSCAGSSTAWSLYLLLGSSAEY